MEILSIIPARGGSKGIKRKNLRKIAGKPLVNWTIEASLNSKYISATVVTTEDPEIAETARKAGAEVIMRPIELAQDETKTAPVMMHTVRELEKQGYKPDYIVLLQPTCPLRNADYIDDAFKYYFKIIGAYDSCFSAFKKGTTHSLWQISHNNKAHSLYNYHKRPRRQDEKDHYDLFSENGAFYALSYETFLKYEDFIGVNPCVYVTNRVVDIDTEEDFARIEAELAQKNA